MKPSVPVRADGIPSIIKDLAEAFSTQAQVANRAWLALLVVMLYLWAPPTGSNTDLIRFPFDLGEISKQFVSATGLCLACVLTISFATAHAQVLRVQMLAHEVLKDVKPESLPGGHDPRDFLDALRQPTLTRVANIAQLARGKHQFFAGKPSCPPWLLHLTGVYYLVLKAVSIAVYFGVPVSAMLGGVRLMLTHSGEEGWMSYAAWVMLFPAGIVLIHLLVHELAYVRGAFRVISKPDSGPAVDEGEGSGSAPHYG